MRIPTEPAPRTRRRRRCRMSLSPLLLITVAATTACFTSCDTLNARHTSIRQSATSAKFAAAYDDSFKYCPVETIRQPSSKASGLAALAAVMQYWELDAKVDALEKKYPAQSDNGYPLLQLRRIAIKEGLIAFALTMKDRPLDQISEQLENGRPVIAPVRLPRNRYFGSQLPIAGRLDASSVNPDNSIGDNWKHHYVVIFGQSDDQLLLMDPAYGVVKIDKIDFTKYWNADKFAALLCSSF